MHIIIDIVVAALVGLAVSSLLSWAACLPLHRRRSFRGMRRSRRAEAWRRLLTLLGLTGAASDRFARRPFALIV